MSYDLRPVAEGIAITSALLIAEHLGLWDHKERVHLLARYILGTAAIGAGVTHIARRKGYDGRDFWAVAVTGGAVVVTAHLVRALRFAERQSQGVDDAILRRWIEGA